jgi:hypothetical protein
MTSRFRVHLMFEWGGGCLWCANDAAHEAFGMGPIEDRLPISDQSKRRLLELVAWHDTALNWDYPPDPGPWSEKEHASFEAAAHEILKQLQSELGQTSDIVYTPLGGFDDPAAPH